MKISMITSEPFLTDFQKTKLREIGKLEIIEAQKLTSSAIVKKVSNTQILIAGSSGISCIDKELLDGLRELEYITLLTVGTGWVDLKYARKKGVVVSNAQGGTAESVAEHIWGMILGLSKRIVEFDRDVRQKGAFKFAEYKGKEVFGKTIGIIGLGDIGTKVVRIAKAFDMNILGLNKREKRVKGVRLVVLDELLKDSDIVVLCLPLTKETKNMISDKEFKRMKEGSILVNCAREEIVNKTAVLRALRSGRLFGYGLETSIMLPIDSGDKYLKHPHIIVTPHNAFNTIEGELRVNDLMIKNIKAYFKGKPINVVN